MRNVLLKVFIGAAVTATMIFGADNSIGTWKLNVAKTKSTSTNPLKSRTEVIEATPDGGIKVTRTDQRADATSQSYSYAFKYDGKKYPVTGTALFDTVTCKKIDENTTSVEVKKTGGKYHQTSRIVISKDGKTRTQTVKGTDSEGKPLTVTNVYDKQ